MPAMRTIVPSVLLLLALPCAFVQADDIGTETWDRMHISGVRSGHMHTITREQEADGQKWIETKSVTDIKLKRLGATTEVLSSSIVHEKPDGTLLRIESSSKMSQMESKTIFTFLDGKVSVETTVMGNTRKVEQDVDKDLYGPRYAERKTRELVGTTDKQVKIKSYMPDYQRMILTTLTSKGLEKIQLYDGTTVEATRIETMLQTLPEMKAMNMKPVSWLDAQGNPIKTSVKVSGMHIETYRVDNEAQATGEGEKKVAAPDVMLQSLITEADPIPVPRQLDRAWYTVRLRDKDGKLPDAVVHGHQVQKIADNAISIQADRAVPLSGNQGVRPLASVPDELKDALAPSSMIQSDAEEIVKIAKEVVGSETNAWVAAQKLERWVFENMTEKNFNTAFASALEACKTREGDCTEHAVLLAALCRAAGIPARVVMGVEFLYGIWGGHAWNDVWIDGTWYQLDATNGYGYVDPLHLPMGQMTMKEGGGSEFAELMGTMGTIDIDITKVVRNGRTITVNDSATLVTAKEGRYRDAIWGLGFSAPKGFELKLPAKRPGMNARLANMRGKTDDGKPVQIRVDVMEAVDVDAGMKEMKWDAAEAGSVDGRPSRTKTETRKDQQIMQTIVVEDGALYIFSLSRASDDASRKAFQDMLDSVDLDVR